MRHLLAIPLVSLFACGDPTGPTGLELPVPEADPIAVGGRLQAVAIGDQVEVEFRSQGCFHDHRGTFLLGRTATGYSATISYAAFEQTPSPPTLRTLSTDDVAALDFELSTIRGQGLQGFCTTSTEYRITWPDGRSERLVDRGCALWASERVSPPRATFGRLLWEVGERVVMRRISEDPGVKG